MVRRVVAVAVLALVAVPATPAAAEQTRAQKLFRGFLLDDAGVSKEVKQVLRKGGGGFVDRNIRFPDLTGDGRDDAVVLVNQGGTAGRIAVYIFSSHRKRRDDGASGNELRIQHKNQNLFRARASVKRMSGDRPHGAVVYSTPVYDPGDELSNPGARRVVEVRWRPRRTRFGIADRRTVDRVRKRFCSQTGDYCTETIKSKRGVVYLELRSFSFEGRYTVCVTTPAGRTDCRQFTLRRRGDLFVSQVRWSTNFPDGGVGRYRVVWRLGRQQLGRALGFRIS
jgi:hypothetical protein